MFKTFGLRFGGVALLALAVACGNDDNRSRFTLSATVDNSPFKAGVVVASTDSVFLTLSGASNAIVMTLHVTVPTTPGTVTLTGKDSTSDYAIITQGVGNWSTTYAGSGSVTFTTSNANEATGTFNFVANAEPGSGITSVRTATNGAFTVRF